MLKNRTDLETDLEDKPGSKQSPILTDDTRVVYSEESNPEDG